MFDYLNKFREHKAELKTINEEMQEDYNTILEAIEEGYKYTVFDEYVKVFNKYFDKSKNKESLGEVKNFKENFNNVINEFYDKFKELKVFFTRNDFDDFVNLMCDEALHEAEKVFAENSFEIVLDEEIFSENFQQVKETFFRQLLRYYCPVDWETIEEYFDENAKKNLNYNDYYNTFYDNFLNNEINNRFFSEFQNIKNKVMEFFYNYMLEGFKEKTKQKIEENTGFYFEDNDTSKIYLNDTYLSISNKDKIYQNAYNYYPEDYDGLECEWYEVEELYYFLSIVLFKDDLKDIVINYIVNFFKNNSFASPVDLNNVFYADDNFFDYIVVPIRGIFNIFKHIATVYKNSFFDYDTFERAMGIGMLNFYFNYENNYLKIDKHEMQSFVNSFTYSNPSDIDKMFAEDGDKFKNYFYETLYDFLAKTYNIDINFRIDEFTGDIIND